MDSCRILFTQKKNFKNKGLFDAEQDRLLFEYSVLRYIKKDFADIYCPELFQKSGEESYSNYLAENKDKLVDKYFREAYR